MEQGKNKEGDICRSLASKTISVAPASRSGQRIATNISSTLLFLLYMHFDNVNGHLGSAGPSALLLHTCSLNFFIEVNHLAAEQSIKPVQ